jgi:predicted PurR-regulated permease PerM
VELHPVTSTIVIIFIIVQALVLTMIFGIIGFGFKKLNDKVEALMPKVDPILSKVDHTLLMVNEKVATIGDKAEHIVTQGEEVAESVHSKVDQTATAVQKTVHTPLIALNALAAGVTQGVKTFSSLQNSTDAENVSVTQN